MLVNSRFFISNLTRRLKCINECTINPYLGGWLALSNFCENSYLAAKKVWGYGLREVWVTRKRSSKYKMGVLFRRKAVRFLVLLLIICYFTELRLRQKPNHQNSSPKFAYLRVISHSVIYYFPNSGEVRHHQNSKFACLMYCTSSWWF